MEVKQLGYGGEAVGTWRRHSWNINSAVAVSANEITCKSNLLSGIVSCHYSCIAITGTAQCKSNPEFAP